VTSAARAGVSTAAAPPDATAASLTRKQWIGRGALVIAMTVLAWLGLPRLLAMLDYFHVQQVQLEGARYLQPSRVMEAIGGDTSVSVLSDMDRFVTRVESLPLVASARVRRRLPGTLIVSIVERTPVALIATRDGFRGVDSSGRRLPLDPSLAAFDAPVVLPAAGARDTAADRRLFNLLGAMRERSPALFDVIDEARRVSATEWQFRTARQRVRVRPEVTLERLADIFPVEQDLERRNLRAAELDLRFRNLVIARLP
jgi:cell division septal protein FtsQ